MKNLLKFKLTAAVLAVFVVLGVIDASAQRRKPAIRSGATRTAQTGYYTVPSGTKLRVRLNNNLNSKTARVGDTFTANVTEPVYSESGVMVIPAGSTVTGRVESAQAARKGGKPGTIDVSFVSIRTPNGTNRSINGSLTDLYTDDAKTDTEGRASGDKMGHRKIIFIGGGGAGGAVLGGAIGGGKGALIGGIIGAVAGGIAENQTKGEDAEVRSGTEVGVYLNQAVSLPRFTEAGAVNDNYNDNYSRPTGGRTYIVQPGDTLGKISQRFYGTSRNYMRIYEANRDRLSSPSNIEVGQELIIP